MTDMSIFQADVQLAAARHLKWMPDTITVTDDEVLVAGWALTVWGTQEQSRFLLNGQDADRLEWPLPSPDLALHFDHLPHVPASRFRSAHRRRADRPLYPDGFARFNVTGPFGEHRLSYRTAWYFADPAREPATPSAEQVARVIGVPDLPAFLRGGATIAKRVEQLLLERFDRPLASFEAVLDWGSGAGRVSRYLATMCTGLTGIDIDPDNIALCARSLPNARFLPVGLEPPTPLPEGGFDLVLGLSVLTHLNEAMQHAWLAELRRLTRPGALLLLSVQGAAQTALYRTPEACTQETHCLGIRDGGANGQLSAVLGDDSYYRDVMHSPDYILTAWARHFEVLDIVEGVASNQDLVLLRRRAD